MKDNLTIKDMMEMQDELNLQHRERWGERTVEDGRSYILWMMAELGEVIDIIKKKNEEAIINDSIVREAFVEEMADVLMYFNEVCLSYSIDAQELSFAYQSKHQKNMRRDYKKDNDEFLSKK